jgi:ribonuclease HI
MERIVTTRLNGFVEHHQLIDKEQEGFRLFHSTTQALLRFTQGVFDGFNNNMYTLAAFVDMEKAYDSVWRQGLMVKLHRQGIRGKMWHWIRDFLQSRVAYNNIQGWDSERFSTEVGLPQGSVISPLLFNLYIQDIYSRVTGENVKFADDGTIWHTGKDLVRLTKCLEEDLQSLHEWAMNWRMNVSMAKTEVCLFGRKLPQDLAKPVVKMDNNILPYNPNPRILGLHLDEELSFEMHISNVERKANKALSLLRIVKGTEKITTKRLLQFYKALVVPQLEYASSVWQNSTHCNRLEGIQRKGLSICLGVPSTSGREAMEVEADILPLALRREELAIREVAKIMAMENNEPLRRLWVSWEDGDRAERVLSPFGKGLVQVKDMETETETTVENMEPGVSFATCLQPTRAAPEYWSKLGSSKNRTTQQEEEARVVIGNIISRCSMGVVIAFTDGSCQPNPGPCGAGSSILLPGEDRPVELSKPVSHHASILLGELVAVLITLEYISCEVRLERIESVHIFSDSQSTIGLLKLGWKPKQYFDTIRRIKSYMEHLAAGGIEVEISWTPGHADIAGNETADRLAKEASRQAAEMDRLGSPTSQGDIRSAARVSVTAKWQRQWDMAESGRRMYKFKTSVETKTNIDIPSCVIYSKIAQLRLGYVRLNKYLHQIGVVESPNCETCQSEETVEHYLLECTKFEDIRESLRGKLFHLCGEWTLTEDLFLSVNDDDKHINFRQDILELLGNFIAQSQHI